MVFVCTKFKDLIFGKSMTVETDHQLLVTVLNKPIHAAPACLQWMMMQLQHFDFTIVHKKSKDMHPADTLSRAPRKTCEQQPSEQDQFTVMMVSYVPTECLSSLAEHTAADTTLQLLSSVIRRGWPGNQHSTPLVIRPFYLVHDELVLQDRVIIKGHKAVIPAVLQGKSSAMVHSRYRHIQVA